MITELYNSASNLLCEIDVKSVRATDSQAYLTGKNRADGMIEWANPAVLPDGRRCNIMFLFSQAEMDSDLASESYLVWSDSHIDRVVIDSDEDNQDAPVCRMDREWYAFAWWGSGPHPARGPFSSLEDAAKALDTFHGLYGAEADSWLTSGDVQLRGPYATREQAEDADISDDPAPRVDLHILHDIEVEY